MSTVLLLTLLFISIIMTGLILIQRSEGGALGIGGGGGGGGGFMSGRSAANSVSRMTGILGAAFLVCCLLLSIVFNKENQSTSILDEANLETTTQAPLTNPLDSVEETDPLADANSVTPTDGSATAETTPDASDETPEAQKKPERE